MEAAGPTCQGEHDRDSAGHNGQDGMAASPNNLEGAREILSALVTRLPRSLSAYLGVAALAPGLLGGAAGPESRLPDLLSQLTSKGRDRLRAGGGSQRFELLAATHTVLVHGAFIGAHREILGRLCDQVGVTDSDRELLVERAAADAVIQSLDRKHTGLPWAGCGFAANRDECVIPFYREMTLQLFRSFKSLAVGSPVEEVRPSDSLAREVVERATACYEAEYELLSADVPELGIWATLGEREATRGLMERSRESLLRLEQMVASLASDRRCAAEDERRTSIAFNRAVGSTSPSEWSAQAR